MKAFQNEEYDIIVDKGTMDCLFCEDNFIKEVLKGMRECFRVLKDGGKMFIFSHGKPKFRHYLFRNKLVPFSIEYEIFERNEVIGKDKSVYLYKLTKGGSSNVIE